MPVQTLVRTWQSYLAELPGQLPIAPYGTSGNGVHFGIGFGMIWMMQDAGVITPAEAERSKLALAAEFGDPGNYEPIPNN